MSSAILWIILPGLVGLGLLILRRQGQFPLMAAGLLSLFLAWAAWQLPIDRVLSIGPFSFEIFPSLTIFGRSFTLSDLDRPLLAFIFLFQTLWLFGTLIAKPPRLFVPISLICVCLFVAALSVDPFLYAALLIALAVLLLIPLLSPPGQPAGPGVLRFLIFQIFAVPFILFTGWILTGVEASPGNLNLILRSGLLLLLGFAFLLALFPFHSWIPMLAKESHPYVLGFLLFFLPTVATIFSLSFFDRYAWLRDNGFVFQILTLIGGFTVLLPGLWALAEPHLGRLLGFAAMMGVGFSLLGIGLAGPQGVQIFFALLLPQAMAIWVLTVSLGAVWRKDSSFDLQSLAIFFRSSPLALATLLLSVFSLSGLPLLASFPPRIALFTQLSSSSPWVAIAALVGCLGLAGAGARILFASLPKAEKTRPGWVEEGESLDTGIKSDIADPYVWSFLMLSAIGLLGFGLFSRLFLAGVPSLASMFPLLFP
ncbi:MAG: hypothetical protein M1347_02175 [Chloroflexi bacterium]|nr:hypothetical protein [Chloroflexota bacterium]